MTAKSAIYIYRLVIEIELNRQYIHLFLHFAVFVQRKILFLHKLNHVIMANKDLNRLKLVLVEQKRTAKWLASEIGKDPATVSKWCTNTAQPSIETLSIIAEKLDVDIRELLQSTKVDRGPIYIRVEQ